MAPDTIVQAVAANCARALPRRLLLLHGAVRLG